ncbi:MAG: uncharacterized membrane protein YqaE (UPF0057 family) [Crocinitomicaceae bacterium]|jgi:uncharacterized membrane protein YqaE (UPF0057 family)
MRKITIVSTLAIIAIIAASCGSSNNVVNNHLISKRKYTKGFFINKKSNLKTDKESEESVAYKDGIKKEKKAKVEKKQIARNSEVEYVAANSNAIPVQYTDMGLPERLPYDESEINSLSTLDGEPDELSERHSGPTRGSEEIGMREMTQSEQNERDRSSDSSDSGDSGAAAVDSTVMTIILVILALIIPPLAVFIFEGASTRFWIDLVLAILGFGVGFLLISIFSGGVWWLLGLISIIYALLIVLSVI